MSSPRWMTRFGGLQTEMLNAIVFVVSYVGLFYLALTVKD
jgi:hypothetical protein